VEESLAALADVNIDGDGRGVGFGVVVDGDCVDCRDVVEVVGCVDVVVVVVVVVVVFVGVATGFGVVLHIYTNKSTYTKTSKQQSSSHTLLHKQCQSIDIQRRTCIFDSAHHSRSSVRCTTCKSMVHKRFRNDRQVSTHNRFWHRFERIPVYTRLRGKFVIKM
jgi:hypothetical protein